MAMAEFDDEIWGVS